MRRRALALAICVGLPACGRTDLPGEPSSACSRLSSADADQQLKARWNEAVTAAAPTRNFTWSTVFPHPTYRQGDEVAYSESASIFIRFWQSSGTAEWVECQMMADRKYPLDNPARSISLKEIAGVLRDSAQVPQSSRTALQTICSKLGC